MERVIADRILNHFTHNIITTSQHGYLKDLFTCTNLLESVNDWTLSLQGHSGVTLAYFDFALMFRIRSCCTVYIHMQLMVLLK